MNVSKIQRLSKTHEDLSAFLKVSCLSGAYLSIECEPRKKDLDRSTSDLILVPLRTSIRDLLSKIENEIEVEIKHV